MKRLILAGFLAFLVVLTVTFPAQLAYKWFVPSDVQLSGIDGSVWRGTAREGLAGGAYIRDIEWNLKPSGLLKGQLSFDASASPGIGIINSRVSVGLDGALSLTDLNGNVPLDVVHQSFQQAGISGDIALDFTTLIITGGLPVEALGSVVVKDFYAPLLSASRIGDFRADFQNTDNGIIGVVQDTSGVLDVDGTVTLTPDRNYVFIGDVAPTPETPPSITNQLQFLGSADAAGKRPFRFEGQL